MIKFDLEKGLIEGLTSHTHAPSLCPRQGFISPVHSLAQSRNHPAGYSAHISVHLSHGWGRGKSEAILRPSVFGQATFKESGGEKKQMLAHPTMILPLSSYETGSLKIH